MTRIHAERARDDAPVPKHGARALVVKKCPRLPRFARGRRGDGPPPLSGRLAAKEVFVSSSKLLPGLFAIALILSGTRVASAEDEEEDQSYPIAFVDRPLTLPGLSLSPDGTFDATNLVKDPEAKDRAFETNFAVMAGFGFGILDSLEVRASLGTLRIAPKVEYYEPKLAVTFRFVGADAFNMGVRAEATMLNRSAEEEGARLQGSLPFLIRFGSSARLDFAPGALITFQEEKEMAFGVNVPVSFAFQMVEALHFGAQTSAYIENFDNPGESLVIPLGFFLGVSLGSTRPMIEIDPYFTWTEFSRPGAELDNDKVSVEKFSAGATLRFYLYL